MPNGQRELWLNRPCPSRICLAGRRITTEREQARVNSIFARSAIPPRYQDVRLSDFDDPRYYAGLGGAVLRARAEAKGLFLWGNVGAGKTSLAVAVLKERLAEGKAGLFIETPDLLDRIRRSYGDDGPNADEVIDAARTVPVLVLDDLGVEVPNDWTREKLYQIINARYSWELETICTTNLPPSRLANPETVAGGRYPRTILRLGDRSTSRLMAMCLVYEFTGPDRRQG